MTTDTERIVNIINAVQKQECLWNVQCPAYAKRDKLEWAWKEVARQVGKSENFCREKWRNVRTGFLRSIQNSFRIVPDDSNSDVVQAIRRKRFYLYDHMKFLLTSAETLEKTRKKRKRPETCLTLEDESNAFSDSTTTLQEYRTLCKYEILENGDQKLYNRKQHNHSVYEELLKELDGSIDTSPKSQGPVILDEAALHGKLVAVTEIVPEVSNAPKSAPRESTAAENCAEKQAHTHTQTCVDSTERAATEYDDREAKQLLDFFRGNIGDILGLPKRKQRLFKRKMLELIDELHGDSVIDQVHH